MSGVPAEDKNRCANDKPSKEKTTLADYSENRWVKPNKRAASYAAERKAKVHQHGLKEGKELTDYEAGIRSGYLQCQSDHSGLYKYKKALDEGKTKEEAAAISRKRVKREEREAAKEAKAAAKAEAKAAKAEAKASKKGTRVSGNQAIQDTYDDIPF